MKVLDWMLPVALLSAGLAGCSAVPDALKPSSPDAPPDTLGYLWSPVAIPYATIEAQAAEACAEGGKTPFPEDVRPEAGEATFRCR